MAVGHVPLTNDASCGYGGWTRDRTRHRGQHTPASIDNHLARLLGGDTDHRHWVARRRNQPEDTGVLLALAQDPEPTVRATAAAGLAHLGATDRGGSTTVNGLLQALRDQGISVAHAAALSQEDHRNVTALEVLTTLSEHPSAQVRTICTGFLTKNQRTGSPAAQQ